VARNVSALATIVASGALSGHEPAWRESTATSSSRCPTRGDVQALGQLLYRAYRGTVDDEGETEEQAVGEIEKMYRGGYGPFDPAHSSVAERDGRVVSATLVTRWQGRPFVAFTMTDPSFARQGLAKATLARSMRLLQQGGERELRLVVTLENEPARALYESMFFALEP
jgi:GNAT superfamily N-acetyltransferase